MIQFLIATLISISAQADLAHPEFSSPVGSENVVSFDHVYLSELTNLNQVQQMSEGTRREFITYRILPLMKFLFGPATHRSLGGPQRGEKVEVQWSRAFVKDGAVVLPFHYRGVWLLDQEVAKEPEFTMPVPLNYDKLFTRDWKKCGDSAPDHATPSFFWYFWDPHRPGCDHVEGIHYQDVRFQIGDATANTTSTFPEYERMIRHTDNTSTLALTVAFGYAVDRDEPQPETDPDVGANEYRTYIKHLRQQRIWHEEPIYMTEYKYSSQRNTVIGRRFTAEQHGVRTTLNVVINAGIDQILLFAQSFAHDHDAFFAWMGHSRVGDGFDASHFEDLLQWYPDYFSLTDQYQLIYWGGCNSYSYYTLPFFKLKAAAFAQQDPNGTRNLDIIAHGLPSYFILNGVNAESVVSAVLDWPSRTSYQTILKRIEDSGDYAGIKILAAVLGDEDNPK